jgi:hypothetical protein
MESIKTAAGKWAAGFVLLTAGALALVLLWPSPMMPALACEGADDGHVITADGSGIVPSDVLEDARNLSARYYPEDNYKTDDFTSQLIGMYLESVDKDFIVIFNPGGWGWDPVSEIKGWESILNGIDGKLSELGYNSLLMDYKRTRHGFNGIVGEMEELLGLQPAKAQELAARIDFITEHLPDIRVIITGESNGATIADKALQLLKDNTRVFAIETGPPVWHAGFDFERSLIITDNGEQADTFSSGDVILILRANAESAFGIYRGGKGDILLYIGAPGHYYSWDYPAVREQVSQFLMDNFARN